MTEKDGEKDKNPTIEGLKKLLENEPNDKVYIKPDGTIDVVNLTEQIKILESENKELRTRVAEITAQHEEDKTWWMKRADELQNRLSAVEKESKLDRENYVKLWKDYSTLLKASECLEKALEDAIEMWTESAKDGTYEKAKRALADFRALKETK